MSEQYRMTPDEEAIMERALQRSTTIVHHTCARCGVADAKVRCYNGRYVHEYAADCFAQNDDKVAALQREIADLREREERVAVAFAGTLAGCSCYCEKCMAREFAEFRQSEAYKAIK